MHIVMQPSEDAQRTDQVIVCFMPILGVSFESIYCPLLLAAPFPLRLNLDLKGTLFRTPL